MMKKIIGLALGLLITPVLVASVLDEQAAPSRAGAYTARTDQLYMHISDLHGDMVVSLNEEVLSRYRSVEDEDGSAKRDRVTLIRKVADAIFAMSVKDRVVLALFSEQEEDPKAFSPNTFKGQLISALEDQIKALNSAIHFLRKNNISLSTTRIMSPNGGIQVKIISKTQALIKDLRN